MRSIRQATGITFLLFLLIAGGVMPPSAAADVCGDIADKIQHGGVVWTENAVVVQGTAAPDLSDPTRPISVIKAMSKRAATLDAYRKAAGILSGIRVTSEMIGADNPRVVSRIQAYVRKARVCKAKYYADGGVDVVVKLPLSGAYAASQMPDAGAREATAASKYTAVIVDASHLPFSPALAPRFLSADGTVVFDESRLNPAVLKQRGAVIYVGDPGEIDGRVTGESPLRTRAVELGARSPSDIVIDNEAARVLDGAPAFLGQGRVVIITGESRKIDCKAMASAVADARVDWENKLVLARGRGRVDFSRKADDAVRIRLMERAAEVDAERRLLEAFLKIRVTGKKRLKDIPGAAERASGVIMNAVRCGARYFKDGSAEVILAAPMDGMAVTGTLLGKTDPPAAVADNSSSATGLVVDAAGLDFEPSLGPQILGPGDKVLYGPDSVARAYVEQYGVAGYADTLGDAKNDPRVGSKPLVVRAKRVPYYDKSILVLGAGEAARVGQYLGQNGPLVQGRVVIVTGPAPDAPSAARTPVRPGPKRYGGSKVREGKLTF
jgi:hypothetical protein